MSTTEPTPSRGPALVGQVDWTAPPLRAALPAFAGALLLALAGLALPWVSGPHADRVIEAGSHAGREGGIGVLLALYALLAALVAAAVLLTGRARPAERPILIVGGLLALAWSVLETSEVGAYAYRAGVSGGPSIGGYVAGIGAVLVTAAGFLAPRDRRADHSNQENLALRWARRGRLLPAAEVLQRLITPATPAENAPGDTLRWRLHLAEILAVLGRFPHAEGQQVLAADSEQWHANRVGAASITGIYDPQRALGSLEQLHQEALARWGAASPRVADVEKARASVLRDAGTEG